MILVTATGKVFVPTTLKINMTPTFIADVHLGKLARFLRMLGFNTSYSNTFSSSQIMDIARSEGRFLLSRSAALARATGLKSVQIISENANLQLQQVVSTLQLYHLIKPFSLCMICNASLQYVSKSSIEASLAHNTAKYYNEFWLCPRCNRVYWKGGHYSRMLSLIDHLNSNNF